MSKTLAIDYGSRNIGIAVSDSTNKVAFGKTALKNDNLLLKNLLNIIVQENISTAVIGYPLNLKGNKNLQTEKVELFEEQFKTFLNNSNHYIKIVRWDERFTSKLASDSMIMSGMKKSKRKQKENIDIIAAAILLQSYLDSLK
jgi:putative Holliday junction resolvase